MEWNDEIKLIVEEQQQKIKERNVKILRCLFSSLNGELFCMEENASTYANICENGVGIDGSSIPGYARTENSDLLLRGDPRTFQFVECEGECAEVVCCAINIGGNGFHPGCPRGILLNILKKIKERNFTKVTQFGELEFFLVDPNSQKPYDLASYCSLPPIDKSTKFRHELCALFDKNDLKMKRVHHENSPGQNEIELDFDDSIRNADGMVKGMQIVRQLAAAHGLIATFSPKPFNDLAGSGLHIHTILYKDSDGGVVNAFANTSVELSAVGKNFIGGLTAHATEITSVFAVSDRSFIRLQPGHEAPCLNSWGIANRTSLVRIPRIENIENSIKKTRIEFRGGDGSGSPYLLAAMILAAGLHGIDNKTEPLPEIPGFNYDSISVEEASTRYGLTALPRGIEECKAILKKSEFIKNVLGEHALQYLINYYYVEPKDEVYVPGKWKPH